MKAGDTVGAYRILDKLGEGGMGEVYRATDTNLGRQVAIKVLPEAVASDAERLARFDREAKTLAALNHQNIAAIYGLERSRGQTALVMELVEGPTLADRIATGPIPVDEALPIATQIAEALEAAHEQGIIHRDLKPANVKVRPDGTVKVLDFGLAKAMEPAAGASPSQSLSPTITTPAMTQAGMILGTAAYMSPEQAKGRPADRRSDVWAFGALLYEMLAGRRAFKGDDVAETMASVLKADPDWAAVPASVPSRVVVVLERCLQRDPKQRLADVQDVRLALDGAFEGVSGARDTPQGPLAWRLALPVAAVAVLVAVLATAWLTTSVPEAEPGIVMRFSIPLPDDQVLTQLAVSGVAISRDGTTLAYVANNQVYVYEMDRALARPLPGTAGSDISTPVFSPDGQSIAFYELRSIQDALLKRVPIAGGTPTQLWEGPAPLSVSWPTDDTIVLVTIEGDAILRIPADGGEAEMLVSAREGERLESPQLLPGGRQVLFTSGGTDGWDAATVYIQALDDDERTLVWKGGSDAVWVGTGHVIYANGNALFALPWDLDRMEPRGGVRQIVSGIQRSSNSDAAQFAVSDNGTLVYVPAGNAAIAPGETRRSSLVWVDPDDGSETRIPVPANEFRMARISPDQRRVALVVGSPGDTYVYNLATGTGGRRTFDAEADETYPLWASDDELLFASRFSDQPGVYSMPADGGEARFLGTAGGALGTLPASLSPDGNILLAVDSASDRESNVVVLNRAASTEFRPLIQGNPSVADPAFAPNGQWVAAVERPPGGGSSRIVLRQFPDVERNLVSVAAPRGDQQHPRFFGDRLLFLIRDLGIYSVDVTLEPELDIAQTARHVVSGRYWYGGEPSDGSSGRAWDVHPDGRLLMIRLDELTTSGEDGASILRDQIDVVANWFTELERLAPTD